MKQFLMWAVIAAVTLTVNAFQASAKDIPAGIKMEIVSVEQDDNEFEIFTYKDNDGPTYYYLGLGNEFRISEEHGFEILGASLSLINDVSLCIGETPEEAMAFLDKLVGLLDEDVNYSTDFPARLATGGERLGDATTVACVVKKKFLWGKYLQFHFDSGKHKAKADLSKSTLKQLRSLFKKVKK